MSATDQLIAVVIQEIPALIELLKSAFAKHDPTALEPTDEQVLAAFDAAVTSSIAKDDRWLAAHPEL